MGLYGSGLMNYAHPLVSAIRRMLLVIPMEDAMLHPHTPWITWEMLAVQAGGAKWLMM